jgi:hypothetical protein
MLLLVLGRQIAFALPSPVGFCAVAGQRGAEWGITAKVASKGSGRKPELRLASLGFLAGACFWYGSCGVFFLHGMVHEVFCMSHFPASTHAIREMTKRLPR